MDTYFGDLLREARERSRLTQKELAKLSEMDHTYLSKIERGVLPPPSRDKVLKLADVLEITDPVERYHLLLAAGGATIEDLKELKAKTGEPESPSVPRRHASFVLAHPPMPQVKNTIGGRIDRLIDMADLSDEERKAVERRLEAVVKELLALIEDTRHVKQTSESKA